MEAKSYKPGYMRMCYLPLLLLVLSCTRASASAGRVITTLPGYDGDLPFYLETGYIGVGESNESQLFYYFVESQSSPSLDPLMVWLTGGPGCSSFSAFIFQKGPLEFDYKSHNGSLPKLQLNPYSWTQRINMLYIDAPAGSGFSYSTTQENYYFNDTKSSAQTYEFLRKWLIEHPQYSTNQLFIGGDSYSGIPLPLIVQLIVDGNENGLQPTLNLKGYVLGNPKTDSFIDENSVLPFAHRLALISTELYNNATQFCGGDYVNIDASNTQCVEAMNAYKKLVEKINGKHILEPICQSVKPKPRETKDRRSLEQEFSIPHLKTDGATWCREENYHMLSELWCNDGGVREALGARQNTIGTWKRCNHSIAYTYTVLSTVDVHRNLTKQRLRALVYSGDHDMSIPHIGTENWIHLLNMTTDENWRAWFVDGQVAGYTENYSTGDFNMIYATVKNGGHVAPEYKPKECLAMMDRFLAQRPL